MDSKIKRICERNNVTPSKAQEMILKTDKKRASYYNYYTNKKWGVCSSYDLCINSGKIGIDKAVDVIMNYLKM